MNEETTVEPHTETEEREQVLVLPGYLFFVDKVELPDGLERAEIDDFAELSLEGLAPFPIEQLYWGYLSHESSDFILIYAAQRERLKKSGYELLDDYTWVLPDFATLDGAHFPEAKTILLSSPDATTRIRLAAGDGLPIEVESRPPGEELPAATVESAKVATSLSGYRLSEQGLPTFRFEATEEVTGHWRELSPEESDLWRADIRDAAFKIAERNKRRLTAWTTRAISYAALFAVILIALEGILFGGNLWLGTRTSKIAEQTPEVRRIEDKQSLMNKLDQVAQNELRPIAILEALNTSRPQGIYFTSTVTDGQNRITIDGIANSINGLNTYTETLRNSGIFELIGDPKSITRSGKTTFTVTLDYTHNSAAEGQNG